MNKLTRLSLLSLGASLLCCAFSASAASPSSLPSSVDVATSKAVFAQRVLPAGTTLDVTFSTGVDFTSSFRATNPLPALVDIANPVEIIPEHAQTGVTKCVAVIDGTAFDMTASRAYFRGDLLRCVDAHDNYVYEAVLEGYVVGLDGKLGIPGSSVSRGDKAQLVLMRDAHIFTPQQLGQVAPSHK